MTTPVRLQVVIPFHEPLSRGEAELDQAWEQGYAPLLTQLSERSIKVTVHFTGHLLDHLARRREDFLLQIKRQVHAKKAEILGGLFYGGIPSILPEVDVRGQVQMMAEYWESLAGAAPLGFWLPELAWCAEVPRLLSDTGLGFGFVSSSQLAIPPSEPTPIVTLERAEQSLPAFVLDRDLSVALASGTVTGFAERAAKAARDGICTVWVGASKLLELERTDPGSLARVLDAVASVETVLPDETFRAGLRARPARAAYGIPPELWPAAPRPDFGDFAFRTPSVDNLTRRMLRASNKLADAIATMEDDELEDAWSDSLATAQRMVFAAQSPDPFLRGDDQEGQSLRAHALARLIRAEALIDALVQGDDDWIATEEEDADADLVDEVFVCNRHLTAWVVPQEGGGVRSLDDRHGEVSLVDPAPRGHGGRGITDLVLDPATRVADVFAGTSPSLLPHSARWTVADNRIDDSGDLSYHLRLELDTPVAGGGLRISKEVAVPIDAAEVRFTHEAHRDGGSPLLVATEIPVVLPSAPTAFLANGDPLEPDALELTDVESLRFECAAGALEVSLEPAGEVWCKITGAHVLVVPVARVEGDAASYTVRVAWSSATPPPVTRAALATESDEVSGDEAADEGDEGEEAADEEGGEQALEGEGALGEAPPGDAEDADEDEDEQPR